MRAVAKRTVFGLAWILVSPLIVICWLEKRLSGREGLFTFCAQLLALLPGYPGNVLRAAFCFGTLERCDWQVTIGFGSLFTHRGARLGTQVSTGSYCVIGHADIGAGTRLASRVSIPSGKRQHLDEHGRVSEDTRYERVVVGEACWIGEAATLLADIGPRSVVSAGAVVIQPMPEASLCGGNPAKVLKAIEQADESREAAG